MRDNPAARLHDLLTRFRLMPSDISVGRAWARVLNLHEEHQLSALLDAGAGIVALPREVERELVKVPHLDPELFTSWRPKAEAALAGFNTLGNPASQVQAQYDEATLVSLAFVAHALRQPGRALPAESLEDLRQALNSLDELIIAADLDMELETFLADRVREMVRAVRLVDVYGVDGLRDAFEATLGAVVFRQMNGREMPDKDSPVGGSFWDTVTKLGGLVALGSGSLALGEGAAKAVLALTTGGA